MKPYDADYFNCDACNPFLYHGGEKGILLLHGFTGSVAHMRPLGDALRVCGYTVMGINLPGHASTEKEMGQSGYREWMQAAHDAVHTLRQSCKSVTVCGLSMGAILALLLAEQNQIDACVSISAPMPSSNEWLPFAGLLWVLVPRIAWNEDESRQALLDQYYDKGYSGFPSRKGADLYHLIRTARKKLNQITCPTLVVQSTADTAVNQRSAKNILENITSVKKEELFLHGVPHVCTISGKLPAIVDAIDRLVQAL